MITVMIAVPFVPYLEWVDSAVHIQQAWSFYKKSSFSGGLYDSFILASENQIVRVKEMNDELIGGV